MKTEIYNYFLNCLIKCKLTQTSSSDTENPYSSSFVIRGLDGEVQPKAAPTANDPQVAKTYHKVK